MSGAAAVYFLLINSLCFTLFFIDKRRAKKRKRRIKERTLLLCCLFGGAPLGMLAMRMFRHKTKDRAFWAVPLMCVFWLALLAYAQLLGRAPV